MKKCANCNKEFDDGKIFCPECGNPLTSVVTSGVSGMTESSGSNGNPDTKPNIPWYSQWKGTILAVVGLIVQWELSALYGMVLVGVGFAFGKDSSNSIDKAVSTVLLVVGLILLFITIIL